MACQQRVEVPGRGGWMTCGEGLWENKRGEKKNNERKSIVNKSVNSHPQKQEWRLILIRRGTAVFRLKGAGVVVMGGDKHITSWSLLWT